MALVLLTSHAFHFGVTGEAWRAAALFNVTLYFTLGIYAAGSPRVARIQALSI